MKTPDSEQEHPLAWNAILLDTPVYSRDGHEVGVVREVLGSDAEDIFHGVVVRHGILSHDIEIPAAKVTRITNRRIDIDLSAQEIRELPAYSEETSFKLGFTGLLRRRLGWVPDKEKGGPG